VAVTPSEQLHALVQQIKDIKDTIIMRQLDDFKESEMIDHLKAYGYLVIDDDDLALIEEIGRRGYTVSKTTKERKD